MTMTEFKDRLTASVDEIEATPDVLARVRTGGARRLRRRRLTTAAISTVAVLAVGGFALTGPGLYQSLSEPPVAAVPVKNDPYGFLMKGETRGDLAGDQAFLEQAVVAWKKSHRSSENHSRGIFDRLQGEPHVYWAGQTPTGRVAVIGQYSELRFHDNIQLDREGVRTLVGYVVDFGDGAAVVADAYPAPGARLNAGFVTKWDIDGGRVLVALDLGKKAGLSSERTYNADGSSGRVFTPLQYKDGVAVVHLPAGTDPAKLAIDTLPAKGPADLALADAGAEAPQPAMETRLWSNFEGDGLWPMTPGAERLAATARDTFGNTVAAGADPVHTLFSSSLWIGYGVTADGSAVYVGEQQLDSDPPRVYAVLQPRSGRAKVVSGGVPNRDAALPVQIKLPNQQGWVVAAKDATLSYLDGKSGRWSAASKNALLVPDGPNAQVKIEGRLVPITLR